MAKNHDPSHPTNDGTTLPGSAGGSPAINDDPPKGWYFRGYLPHYDAGHGYQMITYRLADALPQVMLQTILDKKSSEQQRRIAIEHQLDSGYGSCILAKPEIAKIVIENWHWFDGKRYELIAFVVMPNHVHLLIRVFEVIQLSKIIHGWKSYTAKAIRHCLLKNTGEPPALPGVWQEDYWDRYIRDEQHYYRSIEYIHHNPLKAGICKQPHAWPWSSACNKKDNLQIT